MTMNGPSDYVPEGGDPLGGCRGIFVGAVLVVVMCLLGVALWWLVGR